MYSIMWKCSLITVIWCTHNKRMLLKSWLMYNFIWKCSLTTVVWSTHMEILQYSIICTVLYGDAAWLWSYSVHTISVFCKNRGWCTMSMYGIAAWLRSCDVQKWGCSAWASSKCKTHPCSFNPWSFPCISAPTAFPGQRGWRHLFSAHTHAHTHGHTHIHTHAQTYARIHTHTQLFYQVSLGDKEDGDTPLAHTHTYTHTCTDIRTNAHTHTHDISQSYSIKSAWMTKRMNDRPIIKHMHMHTHTHTHTHDITQSYSIKSAWMMKIMTTARSSNTPRWWRNSLQVREAMLHFPLFVCGVVSVWVDERDHFHVCMCLCLCVCLQDACMSIRVHAAFAFVCVCLLCMCVYVSVHVCLYAAPIPS